MPGYSLIEGRGERFDRDKNGWLDDVEDRASRRDLAWRRQQSDRLRIASTSITKSNAAQWETVFVEFDRNRDGVLSAAEIDAAIIAKPAVFGHRTAGLNGSASTVMSPYNLNSDLGLDRAEFRNLLADPRLLAEWAQSPDWVEQFGLRVEQCDKNDDGVLDTAERAQTLMLIRPRGRNTSRKFRVCISFQLSVGR